MVSVFVAYPTRAAVRCLAAVTADGCCFYAWRLPYAAAALSACGSRSICSMVTLGGTDDGLVVNSRTCCYGGGGRTVTAIPATFYIPLRRLPRVTGLLAAGYSL